MAESGFEVPAGTIVMNTAVDMQELDRELRKVDERGEEAGRRTGEAFGGGFEEGASESDAESFSERLGDILEDTGDKAEEAGKKVESADEQVDEMGETFETTAESGTGLALILAEKVATGARKATAATVGLAEIGLDFLAQGMGNLGRQLQQRSDEMERFGVLAEASGRALEGTAHGIEQVAQALTALRLTIGAGALALFVGAERSAARFEESFNRVETVATGSQEEMQQLRREVSGLSADMGVASETANETLFKILTRMPRLADDTDKALEVLRAALMADAAGFADAAEAASTYEAVLQGFQMETSDATDIADQLTVAQNRSGASFQDIGNAVSEVGSLTNALNGEFEDLLALYQTLVPTGRSVGEVTTGVQAAIQGIIDPTSEAQRAAEQLGIDFSATALRAQGLQDTLLEIIEATEGRPELIADLFGQQEAQTLLITLASRTEKLGKELRAQRDAAGEFSDGVDEMNDSISRQLELIGDEWSDALRQTGFTLDELTENVGLNFLKLLRGISGLLTDVITVGMESVGMFNDLTDALTALGSGDIDKAVENLKSARNVIVGVLLDAAPEAFGTRDFFRDRMLPAFGLTDRQIAEIEGRSETLRRIVERSLMGGPGQQAIEEAQAALDRQRPIADPAMPARADFTLNRIEQIRAAGELRAQMARMAGKEEEQVQHILTETQAKVNRLVETQLERMRAHDASTEALARVAAEWEDIGVNTERVRRITSETAATIEQEMGQAADEAQQRWEEATGAITEIDTSGLLQLDEDQRLSEFEKKVRTLRRRLDELASEGELNFEHVQEAVTESGLTLEQLRRSGEGAINALIRAIIRYKREQEGADEGADELADNLSKIASIASGVLNAAEAMGELDDQTRRALQSVTALVQAGAQIASGNIVAGVTQGLGALGNLVSALIGPSDREKVIERNTSALLELKQDIDKLRSVLSSTSGDVLELRDDFAQFVSRIPENFGPLPEGALPEDRPFGTEDSDIFSEAEATGGEVEAALSDIGISFTELRALAQRLDVSIENITKAMEEGEASADGVRQEFLDLNEAMQELRLEELFEGFSGQMERIRDEIELFDIEDPSEQLRMFREQLLEFADLPDPIAQAIGGADLSTAEGRRQFEQAIQEIFRMLASGQFGEGALGDLTPSQLRDILKRMEGIADRAAEEGDTGSTSAFQVSRQITEVTANRMIGTLTTISVLARQRNRMLSGIASQLGASVPESIRPPARPPAGRGGDTVHQGDVTVQVGSGAVQVRADGPLDREDGREAGRGFIEVLDRRLGVEEQIERRREGRQRRRR